MSRPALALALALLAVTAGCLGSFGDSDRERVAGTPAALDEDAAAEAGYERAGGTNHTLNATITVKLQGDVEGRESQDVTATVPVTTYNRSTDNGPAVLAVASSPHVQVVENPPSGGDPLGTLSTAELVGAVQTTYENPADLTETDTRTVQMLGTETTLTTYHGTAIRGDSRVDVTVHVGRARDGGDVVTLVAVHPRGSDERDRVVDLAGAIRH